MIEGAALARRRHDRFKFLLVGDEPRIKAALETHPGMAEASEILHCEDVIAGDEKPSKALRRAKTTSMGLAVDAVKRGQAGAALSAGNTGALMAISMLRLRRAPGVDRPAIAVLWPSRGKTGHTVVLDVGADIRAEARDLVQYAIMGTEYARLDLNLDQPRVGLLNVGTEEHKGRAALHEAATLLESLAAEPDSGMRFVGFAEGSDIGTGEVDVIVTDGFTGNVALKTAEGTATLIHSFLREAMGHSVFSRIGALFALTSLRRLQKRLDPRRRNGGVFLGLNGAVVKSHGGADATGVSAAIKLAFRLAQNGFTQKVAERVAKAAEPNE